MPITFSNTLCWVCSLQCPLRRSDACDPLIDASGLAQCPRRCLEYRFNYMVRIVAIMHIDMQVHAASVGKGPEELFGQANIEMLA